MDKVKYDAITSGNVDTAKIYLKLFVEEVIFIKKKLLSIEF